VSVHDVSAQYRLCARHPNGRVRRPSTRLFSVWCIMPKTFALSLTVSFTRPVWSCQTGSSR
jgi:hypothetical protein